MSEVLLDTDFGRKRCVVPYYDESYFTKFANQLCPICKKPIDLNQWLSEGKTFSQVLYLRSVGYTVPPAGNKFMDVYIPGTNEFVWPSLEGVALHFPRARRYCAVHKTCSDAVWGNENSDYLDVDLGLQSSMAGYREYAKNLEGPKEDTNDK